MDFIVIEGDIARQRVDALVAAADTSLEMSGGTARALRDTGGKQLEEKATEIGPLDPGGVAVTDAFSLPADYVLHAAAKSKAGQATKSTVRNATRNALGEAAARDCRSIVLPAIGCGVGDVSLQKGARAIIDEIDRFESEVLTDIRLIAYTASNRRILQSIADEIRR